MNKSLKKYFFLVVALLVLAFVAACGNSDSNSSATTSSSTSETANTNEEDSTDTTAAEEDLPSFELTFGHFGASDNPQHIYTIEPFAEEVAKLTDGRVTIEIYPGAALAPPPETYNSVINGVMDMGWGIHGYNPGKWPLHQVLNLPFVVNGNAEKIADVADKLYHQFPEIQAEYEDVKPLWFFGVDEYMIITKGKAIRSLDDIKGLKIRSANPEISVLLEKWGATPVSMPVTDLYDALQKGIVHGSISSLVQIDDFQLYDVIDYATYGNYSNNLMYAVMNKDSFAKLAPQDQEVIENLISDGKMSRIAGNAFDRKLETTMEKSLEAGIELIRLSDEEYAKFTAPAEEIIADWIAKHEAEGLPAQEIYDAAIELMNSN